MKDFNEKICMAKLFFDDGTSKMYLCFDNRFADIGEITSLHMLAVDSEKVGDKYKNILKSPAFKKSCGCYHKHDKKKKNIACRLLKIKEDLDNEEKKKKY